MDLYRTDAPSIQTDAPTRIEPDRRRSDRTMEGSEVAQLEGLLTRLQLSTREAHEPVGF